MAESSIQNIIDLGNTALTDVKMLPLTKGKFAIVDAEDYESISRYSWNYAASRYAIRSQYIKGSGKKNQKSKYFYMHREIMDAPKHLQVDHINGDGLDNRRCNLRLCSQSENNQNQNPIRYQTSSKYKGVCWSKLEKKWKSYITVNKKRKHLGTHTLEKEAAITYNEAALLYFGEFARLNKI